MHSDFAGFFWRYTPCRSIFGFEMFLGHELFFWKSEMRNSVVLSSFEAKYMYWWIDVIVQLSESGFYCWFACPFLFYHVTMLLKWNLLKEIKVYFLEEVDKRLIDLRSAYYFCKSKLCPIFFHRKPVAIVAFFIFQKFCSFV